MGLGYWVFAELERWMMCLIIGFLDIRVFTIKYPINFTLNTHILV